MSHCDYVCDKFTGGLRQITHLKMLVGLGELAAFYFTFILAAYQAVISGLVNVKLSQNEGVTHARDASKISQMSAAAGRSMLTTHFTRCPRISHSVRYLSTPASSQLRSRVPDGPSLDDFIANDTYNDTTNAKTSKVWGLFR